VNDRSATGGERSGRRPSSPCPSCGAASATFYDRLHDELLGTPGEWRLSRCSARTCGLVFLDPGPGEGEAARAYENYYTHAEGTGEAALEEVHGSVRLALHRLNLALLRASGVSREKLRVRHAYLGDVPPGRLLEVGCGSGWRLAELRRLGWDVVGQEVDESAAIRARETHGLTVIVGPLEKLGLSPASFDAVTLSHVIEHVPDPAALLRECWRLVKPGGVLVGVTPNVDGIGRRAFGRRWRGLEPPRHVRIFSPRTLALLARSAGIDGARVWTTAANAFPFAFQSMTARSGALARPGDGVLRRRLAAALVQHLATAAHAVAPSSGDECVLWAVK
jgi:2-polyprenyl-3-methyl-5-hydroxy-6-metoxy-1,4-benzoquinol methylase